MLRFHSLRHDDAQSLRHARAWKRKIAAMLQQAGFHEYLTDRGENVSDLLLFFILTIAVLSLTSIQNVYPVCFTLHKKPSDVVMSCTLCFISA